MRTQSMSTRIFALLIGALVFPMLSVSAAAQTGIEAPGPGAAVEVKATERTVGEWLLRMHEASRQRTYVGTFVVQAGGQLSSARIWHACDGEQQMERVESLTGTPRSTFRRNDQVMTFCLPAGWRSPRSASRWGSFPTCCKRRTRPLASCIGFRPWAMNGLLGWRLMW